MIRSLCLTFAASIAALATAAHAKTESRPSEFRPGVTVEHVYKQQIEYYFTNWFGRVEKSNGQWRDVYFETNEKYVNKGVIRFSCSAAKADIEITLYDTGEYGKADNRRVVGVRFADRKPWQEGRLEPLYGETPPYEFYLAARKRFCK